MAKTITVRPITRLKNNYDWLYTGNRTGNKVRQVQVGNQSSHRGLPNNRPVQADNQLLDDNADCRTRTEQTNRITLTVRSIITFAENGGTGRDVFVFVPKQDFSKVQ